MPDESFEQDDIDDEGVLDPSDTLDGEPDEDPLDAGYLPADRWSAGMRYGSTEAEERAGESLDQLLAEEEPDLTLDPDDERGEEAAGEDEDAVAAAAGAEVVLEAFVAEELLRVGAGGAGHAAELRHLPAEETVQRAKDALAFWLGYVRKGEGEIAETDASETTDEVPGDGANGGARCTRDGAR